MSAILDRRSSGQPEERADQGQDRGQRKLYVEPQVTREEVLPDIIGTPNEVYVSPANWING